MPRRFASDASLRTHSDWIEARDHSTIEQRAAAIASSIVLSNDCPSGIFRSHHTVQPRDSSVSASAFALARSSVA